MRPMPRWLPVLLLLVWPALLAASDPAGDAAACPGITSSGHGDAPDLISARGEIVEFGTSALWTLRFADDLVTPDEEGKPFRIDLLLHDPSVPAADFAYYHDVNRLLRYDAVLDPSTQILLLPERGKNVFLPPRIDGDTVVFQAPGRILSADEDETGTSPGIEEVRWTVVVRDEGSCDLLGAGRPVHPMVARGAATPSPPAGLFTDPVEADGTAGWVWATIAAAIVAAILAGGLVLRGRRRTDR